MHVDILKYLAKENNYDKDRLCFFPCGIFLFFILFPISGELYGIKRRITV